MACDIGDIYDLVIILMLCFCDRDACCSCLCGCCKRKFLHAVRFVICFLTTAAEWAIIVQTGDDQLDDLKETVDKFTSGKTDEMEYRNNLLMFSLLMFATWVVFTVVFIVCVCSCKANKGTVLAMLMSYYLMLSMDAGMLVFTILSATSEDEALVDYTNFNSGFRSTVFFPSMFDILHAIAGIYSLWKNKKTVIREIYNQDNLVYND